MRNTTENLENSTTDASLYWVWVPMHDDKGCRLVAIWIDPALTAFEAQMEETTSKTDATQAEQVEPR